mgnify:FL=1
MACCGSSGVGSGTAVGCCSCGVEASGSVGDWGIAVGETAGSPDGDAVAWRVGIGISSIACSIAEQPKTVSKVKDMKTILKYFIHPSMALGLRKSRMILINPVSRTREGATENQIWTAVFSQPSEDHSQA